MKLTKNQLKSIIYGAYLKIDEDDGYISFSHFSLEQLKYLDFSDFFRKRAVFSSSVTVEFITDAEEIGFSYKIMHVGSKDSLDVYCDGFCVEVKKVEEMENEGRLSFSLPKGKKEVTVYLPCDLQFSLKDFYINGSFRRRIGKRRKVLWIGDSITQGYGTFLTGQTYVNVANRKLKWDILNQGMGGYRYDANILTPMENYSPDRIVVALGVNGHINPDCKIWIQEFYDRLSVIYPNIPTLVITPLWSGHETTVMEELVKTISYIRECAGKYPNIKIVDGFMLVPHSEEFFCDKLHPNALGATLYAERLVENIRALSF